MKQILRLVLGFDLTPFPPLRREPALNTAGRGGEGVEDLKEAGAFGPRLLQKTSPLPRLSRLPRSLTLAVGGVRGGGEGRRHYSDRQVQVSRGVRG
jgi:hypothetical protein